MTLFVAIQQIIKKLVKNIQNINKMGTLFGQMLLYPTETERKEIKTNLMEV
jgi:hypothetical protein